MQLRLRALCMQKPCHCQEALQGLQSFTGAALDLCIRKGGHIKGVVQHGLGCASFPQPQDSLVASRWATNLSTGQGGPSIGTMQMPMPSHSSL